MSIRTSIQEISKEATLWRQDLHANPGIAYDEQYAGRFVLNKLSEFGFASDDIDSGWGKNPGLRADLTGAGGHGVVVTIKGNKGADGDTIGLRADMDALPFQEETGLPYASKNDGVMHACGHDGHTAILLAVAKYFSDEENRDFKGELKLVFQPAEEAAKGAQVMLKEGLLAEEHPMNAMFALHNWPDMPLGEVGIHEEAVMASSSYFDIEINGKSAHAALPKNAVDADAIASRIKLAIRSKPTDEDIVSSGKTDANGNYTQTAGNASIGGTIRTYSAERLADIKKMIEREVKMAVSEELSRTGANLQDVASLAFRDGSPATINDPKEAAIMREVANKVFGESKVKWNPAPSAAAEDFGFYGAETSLCYIWLGQADPYDKNSFHNNALHNSQANFNDDAIPFGVETFVSLVEHRLG